MKRLLIVALAVGALFVGQVAGPVELAAQAPAAKAKTMTANGTVKAVTGNSLTVTANGKDMTFSVDKDTKFVGKGLGTKAKAGPVTATDAVGNGDKVRVTYHDMGGTLHAANVSIQMKATVGK
jgi:hypothetical protein